jgi:hypothetical protein
MPYVEDEDLGVKPLLTSEERASFHALAIDPNSPPEAVAYANTALATDDALRGQLNARIRTAVFRRPSVADRDDIELEAYAVAQKKATSARIPIDQNMVNFAAGTVRVRYLLERVEDANGMAVGGLEAIPPDMVRLLSARLTPWVELTRDARDFLRPPAQASGAASGQPSDTQPLPPGA